MSVLGTEHKLLFMSCGCEPLAVTMARAELWPATPSNPRYAFSFSLLDWMEALLLEAQVSVKDFWNTLKFRCPFHLLGVHHACQLIIHVHGDICNFLYREGMFTQHLSIPLKNIGLLFV